MKRLILVLSGLFLLTMATTSPLFAETEPNNALGEATEISINTETTGTLGQPGDLDWYKVTLTTPGRLKLSVTSPPSNIRIRIELYNRHGEYSWWVANTAVNDGDSVYLSYDVVEPGTYFVRVNDADGDVSTSNYTFGAEFTSVTDAQEPNNDPGRAFLINSTSLTGKIFSGGDEDWFKIYVQAGGKLQLTVASPPAMVARLELYNPNFGYMWWAADQAVNPGDTLHLDHTVQAGGMYYIRLTDARGFAHVQPYTLSITGGTPGYVPPQNPVTDEAESNNELGLSNLIALATTISSAIQAADDDDWYRLNIPNAGQLKVDVTQVPSNLRLRVNLYNRSGAHLLSAQSSDPGTPFSMIFDIPAADTYYLMLEAVDNGTSATNYVFSTVLTDVIDAYEPNNNYGDAKALVQQNRIEAYIFPVGDQDWYKIEISQPGDVQIILSNVPKNIIPEINFYNLSKSYLAGKSGIAGDDLVLVHRVSAAGSYFVQISDGGSNDESTAPYTLTIFGGNFSAYAPIAKIDAITPGSTIVGESVQFSGSGTDQDGTIQGYNWRSSIDGNLSTLATFSASSLSIGTHTIYFKVQDNSGLWSTEKSEIVYVGTGVATETEANSPIGNADEIALNHPVTAKIDAQGDEDFFKVYADRPGRLTVAATNVPANLRLALELYNRNLDYLFWVRSAGVLDGDTVSVSYDVADTGWYYIRVIDSDGDVNADYTYTLNATLVPAVDPQEPNNQMLDAYLLTTASIDAYLFPSGDLDWYRVWADAGQNLKVDLTDIPANLRLRLEFYDRDRGYMWWMAKEASNKGDVVSQTYPVEKAGFVYIRVNDLYGELNWTQKYRMTITGGNVGYIPPETPMTAEHEVNNEIADGNLIGFDAPISATIGAQGDEDWFKFEMGTAGVILAKLTDVPSDLRMRIRIFQFDGGQINYGEATNAGDSLMLETRITKPGTYFVLTDSPNGKTNAGTPYRLTVSALPASDAYEPNNRFGDATVLKGQNKIQAMIFDRGDEDWYRVTADAGATLTVTVADVPAPIRPLIEIYNRHRNYLTSKAASNNGQALSLVYPVTETADYWIRIADVGWDSFATTPYTLIITGAHFTSFTPLAFIDSVSPNPVLAGESVTLTGHGQDTGGSIIGYAWRSSRDGEVSQSQIAQLENLSTGVHTIYFRVKDNDQNWSPETSTILYVGISAPGEQEPNNEIGAANPIVLDTPFTGTIDPANDLDFYRIEITQPVRLTINATNPTGTTMRTRLEMYSPNADYAWWQTVEAQNTGEPVTLPWDINTVGTYYLRVNDNNGNAGNRYTLTVHLQAAADAYEPNDDVTHASPIALQDNVLAYVFPGGNLDWYKVTTDKPGRLTVSLTNMPADLRGRVEIYDRNLNYIWWVAAEAKNDGDNVFVDYNIAAPGAYFIRINDIDGHANPDATYRLAMQFKPTPDTFEPNDDFHQAKLLMMSPVEAYLFPDGDLDFYKIYAEAGKTIQIKADNMPANLRLRLELYDGNNDNMGWWVAKEAAAAGQPVSLDYLITESGYYFIRVNALDGTYSADAPYRLSVTDAKLDYVPSGQVQWTENEPNGAFRSATQIGIGTQAVTGSFASTDDNDWFRFEVTQPGRLTISLTVPSLITSEIRLYDANRTLQASRDAENRGDASQLVFDVNKPGTWYLWIHAKGGLTSTENYQLSLSLNPAADPFEPNSDYSEAKLLAFAQPVQPFIFPVGDRDWFKIKTEEPGLIRFMIENVPQNLKMGLALHNENKEHLLTKEILNAGDPLEEIYLAPVAGTYYFQVYDRENNRDSTEPYKLTVFFTPMVDSAEPNDSFGYPTLLEKSNRIAGLIYPNGDQDWYRFYVKDAGALRIQMAQTDGIDAHIRLYTDSKQEIAGKVAKNKGDTVELTYPITKPDFYYVAVNDEGNNDHSLEPYVLTIAGANFETYYPLAAIQRISPNPAIVGTPVELTGTGSDQDGTITGFEWSSDRDGVIGRMATITLSNLSAGTHRIGFRVQDQQGNWSATVYQYLYMAVSISDESEYNHALENANVVPLRQWIRGRIYPQGDLDFYKIYLDRPGNLSVRLAAVPDSMRGRIEFYNEKGEYQWWRADEAINPGDWIDYHFFADPGWYYAKIMDLNGQGYRDPYALFFDLLPAADRYEPNDSISQATQITLNSLVTDGFIGKEGDLDWYQVNIQQKGRLGLSLKHAEMRGRIEIYNADYDHLYWVAIEAYNGGDNVLLNFDADLPGIYYIRINDRDGRAYTTPYTFENTFTPVNDLYEENDSIGAAKLLPVSGVVDAFIFPAGDLDWFKIYATAGQQLSLSVTNIQPEMKAAIEIYNQNLGHDWWVRESGNNPGDAVYLTYTVPKDGFTYIRINDDRGLSYTTAYRLTVSGGSPGYEPSFNPANAEIEPNGDSGIATDIPLDTSVIGKIDPADDYDWYRFYINSPGIVTISHTGLSGEVTSEMWVYNADKGEIGYRTTTNAGEDNILALPLTRAGYYWVRLADSGRNNASISDYTLRITHTPVIDTGEPNNNNGTATRPGQNTVPGYIFNPDDQDWYRVYVRQPGNLVISLDAMPAVIRPHIRLYNADRDNRGDWLASNAGQTGDNLITYAVTTPGFYFVQIYDEGYDDGTGYRRHYSSSPYTLRIAGADFSHAPLLDPIGDRTIDETIPYGFTIHATDPLSELNLSYSASNLPSGAVFDSQTRTFSWTPARGQAGSYPGVQFTVTDGTYQDSQAITITVNALQRPPKLAPIGDKTAVVGMDLTFTLSAADPDAGAVLTYSASNLPTGAAFTPATATFHWTPTKSQVGLFKNVKFEVTDGTWTDFAYIDIEVRLADLRGDINGDKLVNLADAILGLQIVSGGAINQIVNPGADVDRDGMIGMPEVIYILQYLSGLHAEVTYVSLINDNFDTLDTTTWWLTRGSNNDLFGEWKPFDASGVTFADGMASLNADITDQVGVMYSKPLAVAKGDILTIKRRVYVHAANREYGGTLSVYEAADPALSASKTNTFAPLFGLMYYNFDYRTDLNLFSLISGGKLPQGPGDYSGGTAPQIPPLWDQWFDEELVYNSGTGDTVYKINGVEKMRVQAGPLSQPYVKIMMHTYGWYTGHFIRMDYMTVETRRP